MLRVEAFMKCLEPVVNNENNEMKCLHPSKLGALRCDVLDMKGENDKAEKCPWVGKGMKTILILRKKASY